MVKIVYHTGYPEVDSSDPASKSGRERRSRSPGDKDEVLGWRIGMREEGYVKKRVVITGSTKGIGLGLAVEFLKRDCSVVVSGRGK